ncbi:MAG: hypothetical protein Q9222_001701 [Ikaeria aurantiellina]
MASAGHAQPALTTGTPPSGSTIPQWAKFGGSPTTFALAVSQTAGLSSPHPTSASQGSGPPQSALTGHSKGYYHQLGGTLIGVPVMLLVLCIVAVAGRLVARRMAKLALLVDDYIAITALLLLTGMTAEQIVLAHYVLNLSSSNGGRPNINDIHGVGKMQLASQITYLILMALARTSILMLYRRIFTVSKKNPWFRTAWYTTISIVLTYSLALLIVFLTQCSPHAISNLWLDPTKCNQAGGYTENKGPTIGGFLNAAIDLMVLLLPVQVVWGLQMTRKRKGMVCGLFGLGLL